MTDIKPEQENGPDVEQIFFHGDAAEVVNPDLEEVCKRFTELYGNDLLYCWSPDCPEGSKT